jgi:shikimate dehydrogenase
MTRSPIDGHTQLVGLIGWPVEHTLSPAMHNAAFDALGLNYRYVPLPAPPGRVEAAVRGLSALGFRGANVTVPHKQTVTPHLDEITDTAQAIGAVNTIVVQDGRLVGHNTDGDGFLAALQETGFQPADKRALVLGAGGAARAAVHALAQANCTVAIHNRTVQRAAKLAHDMQHTNVRAPITWVPITTQLADLDLDHFDLLVNATPIGMWPHTGDSPWPENLPFPSHWIVFDLVYNPPETRFLRQARKSGAHAIGGLEMLVRQGALAFEMWTGKAAPVAVMRAACKHMLRG